MTTPTIEQFVGASALLAAVTTVVGMVTLLLFFARGGPWGKLNDASSVVLMLAMVPIALLLAVFESEVVTTTALVVAAIGIIAMLAIAVLQAALVAGRVTYDQTKLAVLGLGAVVGVWYLLTGLLTEHTAVPGLLRPLAIAAGVGFIAVGFGFAVGGERHAASTIGGLVLFIGSTAFLAWLGLILIGGSLRVPTWNQ